MVEVGQMSVVKVSVDPMVFITNLHLMYTKTNLLKMNKEKWLEGAPYEESFVQKKNNLLIVRKDEQARPSEEIEIEAMIERLKALFSFAQKGGGLTLDHLKDKIRKRIYQIKPRYC